MARPKPLITVNIRVQAYIERWEQKVTQKLQAAKTKLFMLTIPHQRASLKTNIETMTAVLELLQGKTQHEHPIMTKQREEIHLLRNWLLATEKLLGQATEKLNVQQKITREVKNQIQVERKRLYESQIAVDEKNHDLLLQLEDTKMMCATKLSMACILNMDLRCQLNNIPKQLQQQTEEDIQEARECMDVCDDMKDTLDFSDDVALKEEEDQEGPECPELLMVKEAPELQMVEEAPELQLVTEAPELQMVKKDPELQMVEEGPELQMINLEMKLFQENEELMVHFTMSDLQQITESEVSRLWEEKENTLRSQEATITQLRADLKKTKKKLKAEKEKKVQKIPPPKKKKPKKQNCILRLFGCIFPKCVESTE